MDYLKLIKECSDKMQSIIEKAKSEQRGLTEEEEKQFNELENKISAYEKLLEKEKKIIEISNKMENVVNLPPITGNVDNNKTENVDIRIKSNPPMWRSKGEFFLAVKDAAVKQVVDDRLLKNAAGMSVSIGQDGGFLVGADIEQWLLDAMKYESVLYDKVTKRTLGENQNSLSMPGLDETSRADGSRWGGVRAYWINEGDRYTATKFKLYKFELQLDKLIALCYVTEEMMQDTVQLEEHIRTVFSSEMGFKTDEAIVEGNGLTRPLGVLNCPALITVSKESGQSAQTILYKNVLKMWNRLSARNRRNAIWLINQQAEEQLYSMYMPTGSGTGVPVFMPAGGISGQQYSTLFGRPVYVCEHCSALGTKGDIILMDPTDYIFVEKKGLQIDGSIHVRFDYDENCFRFRFRANGAPYTKQAIASKKNSNFTTSPYVTLEDRT